MCRKRPCTADEGAGSESVSTNRIRMSGGGVIECREGVQDVENELNSDAHEGVEIELWSRVIGGAFK